MRIRAWLVVGVCFATACASPKKSEPTDLMAISDSGESVVPGVEGSSGGEVEVIEEQPPVGVVIEFGVRAELEPGLSVTLEERGHKHGKGFSVSMFALIIEVEGEAPVEVPYRYRDGVWLIEELVPSRGVALTIQTHPELADVKQKHLTTPEHIALNRKRWLTKTPYEGGALAEDERDERARELIDQALARGGCPKPTMMSGGFSSPGGYSVITESDGVRGCGVTVGVYSEQVWVEPASGVEVKK